MKILNTNISFSINSNSKLSISEKENHRSNVIKFNNKNTKSKGSNFINSIISRNKEMQERIDDVKLSDFKHLLKLEDDKKVAIKGVKDICEQNKDKLSQWNGISHELNTILSGNVDSVLQNMNSADVSKHITNLQIGVVFDDMSDLKKYYASSKDSNDNFIIYRKSKGEDSTFNSDELTGDKADNYSLLDTLKTAYKNLFRIDDSIKTFKKDSKDRLDEMQKNMKKIIASFKTNKSFFDDVIKSYDNVKKEDK